MGAYELRRGIVGKRSDFGLTSRPTPCYNVGTNEINGRQEDNERKRQMKLIKGENLDATQRIQVFASFVNRHHSIGKGKYYATDNDWLVDHAFYFTKDGRLSAKHNHCEPHFMAD